MIGGVLLSLIAWGVVLAAPVQASEDDWALAIDPAQRLTTASIAYSSGQSVIVTCRAGDLNVIVRGLNPDAGLSRYARSMRRTGFTWATARRFSVERRRSMPASSGTAASLGLVWARRDCTPM